MTSNPSPYELRAIKEIHAWEYPKKQWYKKTLDKVSWPIDKSCEMMLKTPVIGWVITKAVGGLIITLNDIAHWTVRHNAIYEEFRASGHKVQKSQDIFCLDLEYVDRIIGFLGAKYKVFAAGEGAGTGFVGLPGIPVDIVAIITLNQRMIGEYATYCGFDISSQEERVFAMNIFSYSAEKKDASKLAFMASLTRLAKDTANKKAWKELEKHAFAKIAKDISSKLTKAKLGQIIPAAGAVVGGGFNIYFTNKVSNTAFYYYRKKFLMCKYGSDVFGEVILDEDTD